MLKDEESSLLVDDIHDSYVESDAPPQSSGRMNDFVFCRVSQRLSRIQRIKEVITGGEAQVAGKLAPSRCWES